MRLRVSQRARTHRSLSLGGFLIFDFSFPCAFTQSTEGQLVIFEFCGQNRLAEKTRGGKRRETYHAVLA